MSQHRPRVLLCTVSINPPGGGQAVAAWTLEALRQDHELVSLTLEAPRLDRVDRYYGTRLLGAGLRSIVPRTPRLGLPGLRLALLRKCWLFRFARRLAPDFDIVISNENETDVGVPCIQYVHFPWSHAHRPEAEMRWFHRPPGVLPLYRWACARLAGYRGPEASRNRTLANSEWTATRVRDSLAGARVDVVPPPVLDSGPGLPWEERRNAFLLIGRLSPEKRVEKAISILERVRARGHEVRLDLVGSLDRRPYSERILRELPQRADWLTFHRDLPRAELDRKIGESRFGIHCMIDEHFGMAVAEMVRGGCLVFAHASGGPAEILEQGDLLFTDEADAVEKIVAVLEREELRRRLRRELAARGRRYSAERFVSEIRHVVASWHRSSDPFSG